MDAELGYVPEQVIKEQGRNKVNGVVVRPEVMGEEEDLRLLNKVREKVFRKWEEEGAIRIKESEEGERVVELLDEGIIKERGAITRFKEMGGWELVRSGKWGKDNPQAMYWLFEGIPVEYKGEVKNMFYAPFNEEEAYDLESIRENAQAAVMGYWEVLTGSKVAKGEMKYPTVKDGFGSEVDYIQASIAAGIWGYGEGYRVGGKLMARWGDEGEYEEVSGQRINETLGIREGKNGANFRDRPAGATELAGEELYSRGLLLPEDFRTLDQDQKKVLANGLVWLTTTEGLGRRFTVGRELAGMMVDRVAGDTFAIYEKVGEEIIVRQLIDISKTDQGVLRAYETSNPVIDVPKEQIMPLPLEKNMVIKVPPDWEFNIPTSEGLGYLLKVREWLKVKGGIDKEEWSMLGLDHQLELAVTAMGLLNAGESEENVVGLVRMQVEMVQKMEGLMEVLHEGLSRESNKNKAGRIRLLFNRIEAGFRFKTTELLLAALSEDRLGKDEGAMERLNASVSMIEGLSGIFSGESEYERESVHFNYNKSGGGEIASVGMRFRNNRGEEIRISIRPEQVEERYSDGTTKTMEASFRATYLASGQNDRKLGLRIDLSNWKERADQKVSMDWDLMKEFGLEHHYEEGFEVGFSNPAVFREGMLFFATQLGVEELMEEEGRKRQREVRWMS